VLLLLLLVVQRTIKLASKAGIPREQFPRSILARMSAVSRACRARVICRTTRHTDKRAALYMYTASADRRPTNQMWQAERGSRPKRRACRRGCYTRKLLLWNVSLTALQMERMASCKGRRWTTSRLYQHGSDVCLAESLMTHGRQMLTICQVWTTGHVE